MRYETILSDSLHFFVQLCALVWCQPNRSLFRLYCYFNDLFLLYNVTLQANSLNWFLRFVRLFVGQFVRCWMIESLLFTTWPNTTYQPTINYFNPVCTRAHWPWLRIRQYFVNNTWTCASIRSALQSISYSLIKLMASCMNIENLDGIEFFLWNINQIPMQIFFCTNFNDFIIIYLNGQLWDWFEILIFPPKMKTIQTGSRFPVSCCSIRILFFHSPFDCSLRESKQKHTFPSLRI